MSSCPRCHNPRTATPGGHLRCAVCQIRKHCAVRGDCWIWTGALRGNYGVMQTWIDGRRHLINVHRLMYALVVGDPGERSVLHSCPSKLCVNPKHLFLKPISRPIEFPRN